MENGNDYIMLESIEHCSKKIRLEKEVINGASQTCVILFFFLSTNMCDPELMNYNIQHTPFNEKKRKDYKLLEKLNIMPKKI